MRLSVNGTEGNEIIPEDLIERSKKGEKINWDEYNFDRLQTSGFTCKSCGYIVMKDEKGNLYPQNYSDIEK